jgi:uncharacterized repeat protein (TIGR03833 family)
LVYSLVVAIIHKLSFKYLFELDGTLWMGSELPIPSRSEIRPGIRVNVIEKQNQRTGALTAGVVARILTKSPTHPHGIKVMLEDGRVGRVQAIII